MAGIGDDLARLAEMRDNGVLTQVEFEEQKTRLLASTDALAEPAMPQPKKSSFGKGCLIILAALMGLIILGALLGGQKNEASTASKTEDTALKGTDAPAAKAEDDAPGVSMEGYNQIKTGMTFAQVTAIIGQPSQEMSRNEIAGIETVMYMWEGSFGANMNAMFQNGKLIQKAQFGLR